MFKIVAVHDPFKIKMRYAAGFFKALCASERYDKVEDVYYRPKRNCSNPSH